MAKRVFERGSVPTAGGPPAPQLRGRRAERRWLVAGLAVACAALIVVAQGGLAQYALFLLILIVGLNIRLRRATGRLAVAPDAALDERQEAVRDHAYRLSYRVLAVAVGLPLWLAFFSLGSNHTWLAAAAGNVGVVVAYLELLFFLPTAVIAWSEPDEVDDTDMPRVIGRKRRPWLEAWLLVVLLVVPAVWSLTMLLPVQTWSTIKRLPRLSNTPACAYVGARKQVGRGIGAEIPLNAQICWNHKRVWQVWGLNRSDCIPHSWVLASVTERCRTRFGHDGTMHVRYDAHVVPTFLPFIHRDVTITLIVRPDGHVVQFP